MFRILKYNTEVFLQYHIKNITVSLTNIICLYSEDEEGTGTLLVSAGRGNSVLRFPSAELSLYQGQVRERSFAVSRKADVRLLPKGYRGT